MKGSKQALDGTRLNAFAVWPNHLVVIGLDTQDGPEHPLYDERILLPLDEALVLNVMVYGVQAPVLVRARPDGVGEVVDGRQRVRAAREANQRLAAEGKELLRVPVVNRKGEDHRLFGIAISANEQRRADSPLARARKAARFLDMGRSEQEVGIAFGVSGQTVRGWLRLLDLPAEVRSRVDAGELSANRARTCPDAKTRPGRRPGAAPGLTRPNLRAILRNPQAGTVLHPEFLRALRCCVGQEDAPELKELFARQQVESPAFKTGWRGGDR